jgi:murein L,D-transpeptidase YcbB/YkuD
MNNNNLRYIFSFPASLLALLALLVPVISVATGNPVSDSIHSRVAAIQNGQRVHIHDTTLASTIVLPALYARRDYTPVWSNPVSVRQLIGAIENIVTEGLNPADYNLATLSLLLEQNSKTGLTNPKRSADLDLLLTDSLIRLGYHLAFGKVDPEVLDSNWNMTRYIEDLDALLTLGDSIESGQVDELLQSLKPQSIKYERLKTALASYRHYQQLGGWEPVPQGGSLKPGMVDSRVPALRARLIATGDLSTRDMYFTTYDDALARGVERFQRRHGLEADGMVGPKTLLELNVPVEARIDQIRANLERTRWVMHDLPDTFIMVDIAGFNVRLFRDREIIWETRAVVGQPYRMSPIFRSTLTHLDLNPTWTVPPVVLKEDLLPELRKDPTYLEQKDMQVIDYQGDPVEIESIEWTRYSADNFPWLIRQQPGPKNALGRIKFMFPNPHSVYLHDTPSKSLFNEPERAFSSGCIRIEHPFELAELLLEGNVGWDRGSLIQAVDSLDTRSISLAEPITIILMYWTVAVDENGAVSFNRDIYQRDPPIIQGLGKPFRFRDREIIRTHGEMAALH